MCVVWNTIKEDMESSARLIGIQIYSYKNEHLGQEALPRQTTFWGQRLAHRVGMLSCYECKVNGSNPVADTVILPLDPKQRP